MTLNQPSSAFMDVDKSDEQVLFMWAHSNVPVVHHYSRMQEILYLLAQVTLGYTNYRGFDKPSAVSSLWSGHSWFFPITLNVLPAKLSKLLNTESKNPDVE